MDLGIQGKVAMVAAASRGIGLAIARALTAEGVRVSICARSEDRLEEAAGEIGEETRSYVVDVAQADDLAWWVEETRRDLGTPLILVTNTGGPPAAGALEASDEQWSAGVDSTLMNVVRLVRLVSPGMVDAGWGRILHVTSLVAERPHSDLAISSTLRAGIGALTELQARELGRHGVTVNALLPGHTDTDRQRHLAERRSEREGITVDDALAATAARTALGRLATPQEIADAAAFLVSERAGYVTGRSLVVDGGANLV